MRATVLALTLAAAGAAQAQQCPIVTVPLVPFTKAQAPAPFGDIAQTHIAWSGGGFLLWRYDVVGNLYFNAIPPSSLTITEIASAAFDFGSALAATDTLAAFNAAYAKHLTRSMDDPELQAVWCPLYPQMLAGRPQPPTPPATYAVANNFAALNRPTYRGNATTLTVDTSRALAARATVGATCTGPAFKAGTASTVYMAYQGGPDPTTVTVCTKR